MRSAIVGIFEDFKTGTYRQIDEQLNGILDKFANSHAKTKAYKTITTLTTSWQNYDTIIIVGLGKEADYDVNQHRKLIGYLIKKLNYDSTILLDTFLPSNINITEIAFATAEAYHLVVHRPYTLKTVDKVDKIDEELIIEIKSKYHIHDALSEGESLAFATSTARDLQNMPANQLTPTILANIVAEFAHMQGLKPEILDKSQLKKLGMGGILGVNQGSTEAPKLITVKYMGAKASDQILALVGKGLTYDTGGYSLKSAMYGMHGDMAGAAVVYGAFNAIVYAKLPVNVILVIPATDNVISATAIKPGDVVTMLNKTTVEVNNTDAEGRLILADAITYAKNQGATQIINVATLTSAIVRALGENTTGAFTNNDAFLADFLKIATKSGESIWELPIFEPEEKLLESSEIADLKNAPTGPGAIIAAAFLKKFVTEATPWIHLDIAGTAQRQKAHELGPAGGTGVLIRSLYNWAKHLA